MPRALIYELGGKIIVSKYVLKEEFENITKTTDTKVFPQVCFGIAPINLKPGVYSREQFEKILNDYEKTHIQSLEKTLEIKKKGIEQLRGYLKLYLG